MIGKNSLKKEILYVFIYLPIIILFLISIMSIRNLYLSKLESVQNNQKQILVQVKLKINELVNEIENTAKYIKNNYSWDDGLLKDIVDINKKISGILILDSNGIINDLYTMNSNNVFMGFDYSEYKFFKNYKKLNTPTYWSSIFVSILDNKKTVCYSFKMGKKIGVIFLNLSYLSDFSMQFKDRNDSFIVNVFDKKGVIILDRGKEELISQKFNLKNLKIYKQLLDKEPYTFMRFKSPLNGKYVYGTYDIIDKNQWTIISKQSYKLILKDILSFLFEIVFIISVFILLLLVVFFKISKRVFFSLDNLKKITTYIGEGKYDVDIETSKYKEFDSLINNFNEMKEQIDEREKLLQNSLDSFRTLFDATLEIVIIHKNGVIVDLNKEAIKFFNIEKREELIGEELIQFVEDDYKKIALSNYGKNAPPYELDVDVYGRKRTCVVKSKTLPIGGDIFKIVSIIDVSELKAKEKLLFQQSKMASMGEMLENIAHQWRQPLSLISTCASSLKIQKQLDNLDEERLVHNLDIIIKNSQYLSNTIDDFRNYFKADKQKYSFDINDNLNKAITLVEQRLHNKNIQIELNYEKIMLINSYENEFLQVILNLLNNSSDALISNLEENRKIFIDSFEKNNFYIIKIKDNAGGIKEEILEKVFEPYFTTKHKNKGTGIGLYMCHEIITKHFYGNIFLKNISIKINSKKYKGCQVTIKIPIK